MNIRGDFVGVMTEFGRSWIDSSGHIYVSRKVDGRWSTKPLHILIYEKYVGSIPAGFHVHHIDHNPQNNDPRNLVALSGSDHRRTHANWVTDGSQWTHKPCGVCRAVKPLNAYRKQRKDSDRLQAECKTCDNKRRVVRAREKRKRDAIARR